MDAKHEKPDRIYVNLSQKLFLLLREDKKLFKQDWDEYIDWLVGKTPVPERYESKYIRKYDDEEDVLLNCAVRSKTFQKFIRLSTRFKNHRTTFDYMMHCHKSNVLGSVVNAYY